MCPQHQLQGTNVILINEIISYTTMNFFALFFLFFFFLFSPFPSFSLSVWTSSFFPLPPPRSLSHCFFFSTPFLFPDWCQKVPDQLVAPASCEKPFYVLLQVIWRGAFSLSTRALICSRFFSDYFTTLRNLILRISTRNLLLLLYFSFFAHKLRQDAHLSFLKEHVVVARTRTIFIDAKIDIRAIK